MNKNTTVEQMIKPAEIIKSKDLIKFHFGRYRGDFK